MNRWPRIIWYVLTLRCDEAERCRCAPDPDQLARYQVLAERLHRLLCKSCRAAKRKLEILDRSMHALGRGRELDLGPGLSDTARRRLLETLNHANED
jgi:hypothetical protein